MIEEIFSNWLLDVDKEMNKNRKNVAFTQLFTLCNCTLFKYLAVLKN